MTWKRDKKERQGHRKMRKLSSKRKIPIKSQNKSFKNRAKKMEE